MHAPASHQTALVLGGGGAAGNAWLIRVLAGLIGAGLDVTDADLVVGTSAGATAAVQIRTGPLPSLLAAILEAPPPQHPAPTGGGRAPLGSQSDYLDRTGRVIAASADAADMHRRMGAAFLEVDDASCGTGRPDGARPWPHASRGTWPDHRMLVTAVDGETGEGVAFDRDSEQPGQAGTDTMQLPRILHRLQQREQSLGHGLST